ncbi:MAG TPA: hypothetical protein VGN57_03090 [Pirellulaceae bacterium]|jgi:hypothetical protein|nr:hypothetical protein [Pirellulaceae bacterium]
MREGTSRARRRAGSKYFGWGAGATAVATTLFAVAPFIVAGTSWRDTAVGYAFASFPGKIETTSVSFNWFGPVSLKNVKAYDPEGALLFTADDVSTERWLWSLAWNSTDVGGVTLTKPELFLTLRKDGSNLEDLLIAMEQVPPASRDLRVVVTEGTLHVVETETGEQYRLDDLKLDAALPSDETEPLAAKFAANVVQGSGFIGAKPAGIVEGEFLWQRDRAGENLGEGQAALRCEKAPLELAQPILRRLNVNLRPAGELTADVRYAWEKGGHRQDLEIRELRTGQASIVTTGLVVSEPLDLTDLSATGRVLVEGERVEFRELFIESDLVVAQAVGTTRLASLSSSNMLSALQEDDVRLSGEIDLAKIVRALPKSLGLEANGTIASGKATFSLENRIVGDAKRWQFTANAEKWTAVADGKVVTWDAPVKATALFGAEQGQIAVEEVRVDSDFLKIRGRGTWSNGEFDATGNLDKLREQLTQVADLKEVRLAGTLKAGGNWNLGSDGRFAANADSLIENFEFAAPGVRSWKESKLQLSAKANGTGDASGLSNLAGGSVEVAAGEDSMVLTLANPVDRPITAGAFPVKGELKGSLASWVPRLQAFLPSFAYAIEGDAASTFAGEFGRDKIAFSQSKTTVTNLAIRGEGLNVSEPQIQAEMIGDYDPASGKLVVENATLASSSLAFRGQKIAVQMSGPEAGVEGELAWRGDLSRISSWLDDPQQPSGSRLFGMAAGNVDVDAGPEGTKFVWSGDAEQFVWATRTRSPLTGTLTPASSSDAWEPIWSEPSAKLKGEATWNPQSDSLAIGSCFVTTETVAFTASGKADEVSKRLLLDLNGQTELNLPLLSERLRPLVSSDFAVTGGSAKPFTLKGPLRKGTFVGSTIPGGRGGVIPLDLSGDSSIDWTGLRMFGFQTGPGAAKLTLRQGIVAAEGIDIPVNEGRLRAFPRIDLNAERPALVIERGTILEQVQFTPEMCRGWMKYAAPLLADATEASGKFSVAIQETSIPLADPTSTESVGVMQIHQATIGPGPLGRQLVSIARQVEALVKKQPFSAAQPVDQVWVTLPEQAINLQMHAGRVFHERMQFRIGDVDLSTQGSVGLDQSLQLVVEAPIRDEWIARDPSLTVLRGQTLKIPVRGSVSQPQVDAGALRDSASQLLGSAAQGALQGQLDKQLNRGLDKLESALPGFFGPRPSP